MRLQGPGSAAHLMHKCSPNSTLPSGLQSLCRGALPCPQSLGQHYPVDTGVILNFPGTTLLYSNRQGYFNVFNVLTASKILWLLHRNMRLSMRSLQPSYTYLREQACSSRPGVSQFLKHSAARAGPPQTAQATAGPGIQLLSPALRLSATMGPEPLRKQSSVKSGPSWRQPHVQARHHMGAEIVPLQGKLCVCTCICVHCTCVHICVYAHMCASMWGEVDSEGFHVHDTLYLFLQ